MAYIYLFVIVTILIYLWLRRNYSFWKRHGVPGPKPTFFVGNMGSLIRFRKHVCDQLTEWYSQHPNEPYIGFYKLAKPEILLRDVDLIKSVLDDNFNSFGENAHKMNGERDPLIAKNPGFLAEDEWKGMRKSMSKVLTTHKTKTIVPVMNEVCGQFINFIKLHPENTEFDAKNLCARFTTENMFRCSLSMEAGCFDRNQNSMYLNTFREILSPSNYMAFKRLLFVCFPKIINHIICTIFEIRFIPKATDRQFRQLVETNIAARPHGIQRNDILQMFIQIQERNEFPNVPITGHIFMICLFGMEKISSVLSFVLYELAMNPKCQEIIYDEINEVFNVYDGQFVQEALEDLVYLEAIIYETLRLHPKDLLLLKICTKRFTLPRNQHQTKPYTILPGMAVNIPVYAIHMDPQYYPNPEQFNPERFYPVERQRRHKGTYLSFGAGPRLCPAIGFIILQLKVALVHTIKNFHINLSRNQQKIVLDPQTFLNNPKNGILIQFRPR